jgi:hypothetical protein
LASSLPRQNLSLPPAWLKRTVKFCGGRVRRN